jgi:transcription initiation factor IIE alpha subunit
MKILKNGDQFTSTQLANKLGCKKESIRARISELRSEGNAIYSNQSKNGKTIYCLGVPSRRMVAAAYRQMGSEVFTRV